MQVKKPTRSNVRVNSGVLSLSEYLKSKGIRPASFAYFLTEYAKQKPGKSKSVLSILLAHHLQAQAELIAYHLNQN